MIWLYWVTSVARAVCDDGSGTAATTAPPAPPPAALALTLIASRAAGAAGAAVPVITWPAPSLVDVKVRLSGPVMMAERLTPASANAWFNWATDWTCAVLVTGLTETGALPMVIVAAKPAEFVNVKTPPLSLLVVRSAEVATPGPLGTPVPVNWMLAFVL